MDERDPEGDRSWGEARRSLLHDLERLGAASLDGAADRTERATPLNGPEPHTPAPTPPATGAAAIRSAGAAGETAPGAGGGEPTGGRHRRTADSLTAETVLHVRGPAPAAGWRRAVYRSTRGRLNPGPSPAERRQAGLRARVATPIGGCHRLAVISLKGGVGKTTTTAALGATFARLRGDRVVAIDANPDRGTLGERTVGRPGATVRDLLDAADRIARYTDVRTFTAQAPSRLEVLASDVDPATSQAFGEEDYRRTVEILERYYSLVLTDCGTGLLHSAMRGVLRLADSLVVVSSPSLDGARSASATLDWLEAHGLDGLVQRAVVVICAVRPGGGRVDVDALDEHFRERCRAVFRVPWDPHLEAGGVVDLDALRPPTREAYLRAAAAVGEGFTRSVRRGDLRPPAR